MVAGTRPRPVSQAVRVGDTVTFTLAAIGDMRMLPLTPGDDSIRVQLYPMPRRRPDQRFRVRAVTGTTPHGGTVSLDGESACWPAQCFTVRER